MSQVRSSTAGGGATGGKTAAGGGAAGSAANSAGGSAAAGGDAAQRGQGGRRLAARRQLGQLLDLQGDLERARQRAAGIGQQLLGLVRVIGVQVLDLLRHLVQRDIARVLEVRVQRPDIYLRVAAIVTILQALEIGGVHQRLPYPDIIERRFPRVHLDEPGQ